MQKNQNPSSSLLQPRGLQMYVTRDKHNWRLFDVTMRSWDPRSNSAPWHAITANPDFHVLGKESLRLPPSYHFYFITPHFCKLSSSVKIFLSPGLFCSDGDCPGSFNLFSISYRFFAPKLGNLYHAHLPLAHREPDHKVGLLAGSRYDEHHSAEKACFCTALLECPPVFYISEQSHR